MHLGSIAAQAYVTEPACLSGGDPAVLPPGGACATEIANPARTYLGTTQKAWLKAGLVASTAKWKFVMNGIAVLGSMTPASAAKGPKKGIFAVVGEEELRHVAPFEVAIQHHRIAGVLAHGHPVAERLVAAMIWGPNAPKGEP